MMANVITTRGIDITMASHHGTGEDLLSGGFTMFKWLKQKSFYGAYMNI